MENYQTYQALFKATYFDPETDYFTPEEFKLLDKHIQDVIISQTRKYLVFLSKEYS